MAYSEAMECIFRKQSEGGLAPDTTNAIVTRFKIDWESFTRVKVNADLCGHIDKALEGYPLRDFDAIHLASALVIQKRLPHHFIFACFDDRFRHAAASEGLETFPKALRNELDHSPRRKRSQRSPEPPMNKTQVLEQVFMGEDSRNQFKAVIESQDILAAGLCALGNTDGGRLFIGVDDHRKI